MDLLRSACICKGCTDLQLHGFVMSCKDLQGILRTCKELQGFAWSGKEL